MDTMPPFANGKARVKLAAVRRALKERPWIMAKDVIDYEGDGGPFVDISDENTLPLGTALYNPDDDVRIRLFSSASTRDPLLLLRTRLERAQARRHVDLLGADAHRLIHAESDGIPRVFVDRFGSGLLCVTSCQAMNTLAPQLVEILHDVTGASTIMHWARHADGTYKGELRRGTNSVVRYHHGRLVLDVDLASSAQISNLTSVLEAQRYVRRWAKGRVLDLYAKDGGFSLQLADGGANRVIAAEPDLALAAQIERVAHLNGLSANLDVENTDPFEKMRILDETGDRFDIVVLHPDDTTLEAKDLESVRRRVFESHRRALRLLDEGRMLITWPGATPLSEAEFESILVDVATKARKRLQVLARVPAGPDHPTLLGIPESRVATTLIARVISTA